MKVYFVLALLGMMFFVGSKICLVSLKANPDPAVMPSNNSDSSVTVDARIEPSSTIRYLSIKDSTTQEECKDTTNVPSRFSINVPVRILNNTYTLQFVISKENVDTFVFARVTPQNKTDIHFPPSFYETIIDNLGLMPWFPNYYDVYQEFRENNFIANDWVGYKKNAYTWGIDHMITVVDINNDHVPEIILENRDNSSTGNPFYALYKWDTKKKKCELVPHFFDRYAFYGWDKTLKYMITGYHDRGERHLIKNKVINYELIAVDSTDVSDAEVFNKW